MSKVNVLIEAPQTRTDAFAMFAQALGSEREALRQAEEVVAGLDGLGLEIVEEIPPVPMFTFDRRTLRGLHALASFASPDESPDASCETVVVAAEVSRSKLHELESRTDVIVWPNSRVELFGSGGSTHPFDLAFTAGVRTDCRPFRPAVTIDVLRVLLGVERPWQHGYRGQNVVVGILDDGVSGEHYPVIGGLSRPNTPSWGTASVQSHGSMCAADVLVAAPMAKLYDYPFLGIPTSGGALAMFQAVLEQRRLDGTPHVTNNSYGFLGRPSRDEAPKHEVWDVNHPLHRKVREVVASGAPCFFAAGNCGSPCPDGRCHPSGIGPEKSIHASNSLPEVITIAAVNSRHERIGYSAQGPGGFERLKPDLAAYAHFFGNYGPGRPAGGGTSRFDSGTSAASPVAAGVGALLMSAFPEITPGQLKAALIKSANAIGPIGWNAHTGHGVVNAAAAYNLMQRAWWTESGLASLED